MLELIPGKKIYRMESSSEHMIGALPKEKIVKIIVEKTGFGKLFVNLLSNEKTEIPKRT